MVGFWVASALVVGVQGDFPLFDDWVYAQQVEELIRAGRLHAPVSSENFLLPQIAWAALVSLPAGFSFEALRVSTLFAAVGGTVAMHLLLVEVGASRRMALFGAFLLCANPLFVSLAFTFMSDVPTISLCVAALWAFARSERLDASRWFWLAMGLATLATINRLTAATVVAGIAVGHAAAVPGRARVLRALAAIVLAFAVLRGTETLLQWTTGVPGMYGYRGRLVITRLLHFADPQVAVQIAWAATRSALVLGWFCLPLFVLTRPRLSAAPMVGLLVLAAVLVGFDRPLPLMGNILYERGLGPVMVAGIEGDGPGWAWWALTAISVVGAAYVAEISLQTLRTLWRERHGSTEPAISALRVASLVSLWGLVLAHAPVNMFDRYLVAALPSLLVLAVLEWRTREDRLARVRWRAALGLLVVMGGFAVLATRDHMQWQRARWQVIQGVLRQGVTASELDGGYEFNGQVRGIGFSPEGAPITHHVALVDEIPADALLCVTYRAVDRSSRRCDLRPAGPRGAEPTGCRPSRNHAPHRNR